MEQKSRLVIEIDSTYAETNLKKLSGTLSATEKQGEKTATSASKVGKYFANASGKITDANGKFVSATKAAKNLGVSVDELSKYTTKLERTTKSNTATTEQATRSNDQHTQSLGMMTSNLKSALLATTALTGGLGGLSVVAMETAADINRFATNVGMSTYDFQYYAASMGVAGKTMEDYGDALKDVYDRLGEVGRGEGEMMDFFEKIAPKVGITADMFKDLSGQEALQLYHNGLEKANLSQAEMVTYMEQIVNDGSYLLPLLKNNGAEFERLGRLANDSGAIMSDSMNKSLIELRGALAEGQMQVKGLGYNLLSNLLPAIKFVAENLDTLVKLGTLLAALYGGKVAAAFAMSAANIAKDTIATVANNNAKKTMVALSASLRGGLPGLAVGVTTAAIAYLLMSENATKANNALLNTNETIESSIQKFKEMGKVQKESQLDSEQAKLKELSNEYDNLTSKLVSTVIGMGRFDESTSSAVKAANKLAMQFKQDGDLIAFTNGINKLNGLSDEAKVKFRTQAGVLEELGKKHANQKKLTDTLTQSMTANAKAVENATGKLQGYSVELTKLLKENQEETYKGQLVAALTQRYGSEDFANKVYEARKAAGILGTTKNLPDGVFANLKKQWEQQEKNKKQIDDINEAEEKRKKTIEEQTKALKVNAKVRENAQKYNFSGLEQKYGLPAGILSAIQMQESGGNTYDSKGGILTSPVGAKGSFQFMPATAKRFNVNVEDMASSAEGAAKYLKILLKMFGGNIDKAIMSYNAGEGNVQSGKAYGFSETRNYLKKIKGYMGGATGAASVVDDEYTFDDYMRDATKAAEEQFKKEQELMKKRADLKAMYVDRETQRNLELKKEIEEIQGAGFSAEETQRLTTAAEQRAKNDLEIYKNSLDEKLSEFTAYLLSEEQAIKRSFTQRRNDVKTDLELTKEQREEAIQSLNEQERIAIASVQNDKKLAALEAQKDLLTEEQYTLRKYDLELDRINLIANAKDREHQKELLRIQRVAEIEQSVKTARERYNSMMPQRSGGMFDSIDIQSMERGSAAQDVFAADMAQLDMQAQDPNADLVIIAEQRKELWSKHQDDLLEIEALASQNRMDLALSTASSITDSLSGSLKDALGEQSATYKAMFAIQKTFAMTQASLNFAAAYSSAFSDPTALTTAQKFANYAALAAAGAQIMSQIASISVEGFANGGLIKGPGTGTSDSIPIMASNEEFMMRNAAVKSIGVDNLNYMNKYGKLPEQTNRVGNNIANTMTGNAVNVQVEPKIIINVPEGYTAQQSQLDDGAIAIDVIKRVVRGTLREDMHNVNSDFGKSLRQTYNVSVKRF